MAGDAERGLESLESPSAQETLAQDQEGPAVAYHANRARERARFFLKGFPLHSSPPVTSGQRSYRIGKECWLFVILNRYLDRYNRAMRSSSHGEYPANAVTLTVLFQNCMYD